MPFVTLTDKRRIFVRNAKEGISVRVQDIYGPEIAADPKVQSAGSFEQAQRIARERVTSKHSVGFISPQKAKEIGVKGMEFRERPPSPVNVKFSDELFLKNLQEKVKMEKQEELTKTSTNIISDKALLKADESKEKMLTKQLRNIWCF